MNESNFFIGFKILIRRRNTFGFFLFLGYLLMGCFLIGTVQAEDFSRTLKQYDKQLVEKNKNLEELEKKLETLKNELKSYQEKEGNLQNNIKLRQKVIRQKEGEINKLKTEIKQILNQQKELSRQIDQQREVIQNSEGYFSTLSRYYYFSLWNQGDSGLQTIESGYLPYLVCGLSQHLQSLRTNQDQLVKVTAELVKECNFLTKKQKEVSQVLLKERGNREKQEELLRKTKQEKARYQKEFTEIQSTYQELTRMITELQLKKKKTLAEQQAAEIASRNIQKKKGLLPWPAKGTVVVQFGKQPGKAAEGGFISNGIKIQAQAGGEVRAVEKGKVVFAADFHRFDKTVIIDHGGGFYSIYAYLGRIVINEGVNLQSGDLVGFSGIELSKNEIYFELRTPHGPDDPLTWLVKP